MSTSIFDSLVSATKTRFCDDVFTSEQQNEYEILITECVSNIDSIREKINQSLVSEKWVEKRASINVLRALKSEQLKPFFPKVVDLAMQERYASFAFEILSLLPKQWVSDNLYSFVDDLFMKSYNLVGEPDDFEVRQLLNIYYDVDKVRCEELACRAVKDARWVVRETGQEFLDLLGENRSNQPHPDQPNWN